MNREEALRIIGAAATTDAAPQERDTIKAVLFLVGEALRDLAAIRTAVTTLAQPPPKP